MSYPANTTHSHGENSLCHGHHHNHHHGKLPLILYLSGVLIFLLSLMAGTGSLQNTLDTLTIVISGYHIIIEGIDDTITQSKIKKIFTPNVHILMTLAALGAVILGDFREGALLILIFAGAHFLEDYVEEKSKKEMTHLMSMAPKEARLLLKNGTTKLVDVTDLKIGDHLKVLNGDQIPIDGIIISGATTIDESSINGESIPCEKTIGDQIYASTINIQGTFTMEVTTDSSDTIFAKILKLVNDSQENISKKATKIKKMEPAYVSVVLISVFIYMILVPLLFHQGWQDSFYKGIIFLTIASPCALAVSDIPATLSAISNLAKRGILFKGGSYLSNLADIKAIAFDKTGTLTEGKPLVTNLFFTDVSKKNYFSNIINAMERQANHPLAEAILSQLPVTEVINLTIENQIGHGLIAQFNQCTYKIGKPSQFDKTPDVIAHLMDTYQEEGKTVILFSENTQVVALIAMIDLPNKEAQEVIHFFKSQSIHTTLITGDSDKTGQTIGKKVGIDQIIGNVLPENKANIISNLEKDYGSTAMVGDGINDAPALVRADIGIAMGKGTDVAIDVADSVLMDNDLSKLSYAFKISKRLNRIVFQNIVFSLLTVILLIILNCIGDINLPVGVLAHEGSTILVLLNGLRLLKPLKE